MRLRGSHDTAPGVCRTPGAHVRLPARPLASDRARCERRRRLHRPNANEPILGGCALRESWRFEIAGKPAFEAIVLRSYDSGGKRWMLSYIDDGLAHQLYEGREDAGQWRFFRERKADDGSTVLVRITWAPSAAGYTQTIERSTDAGATWTLGSTIAYDRR